MNIPQSILQVSGQDAFDFLQGQLTCDLKEITATLHPGALCNTKGRVVASFNLQKVQKNFYLHVPSNMMPILLQSLQKYARFAEVTLTEANLETPPINLLENIRAKIAVILPETSGLYTPHELDYHKLGFVSFQKGCYMGQEIVARMHYLGKLKKQLRYLQVTSLNELPEHVVNCVKVDETHFEALVVMIF